MNDLNKHYNKIASDYSEIHPFRPIISDFVLQRLYKNEINTGIGLVVDYGCGSGDLLADLRGKVSFPDMLLGIDASKDMVFECKSKALNVYEATFESFTLEPASVRLAIFQESVHHADMRALGEKLRSSMDEHGEIIVFYQDDWDIQPGTEALQKLVSFARAKRKGGGNIVKGFKEQGFDLVFTEELISRDAVNLSFLEKAIYGNALSYWKDISKEQKEQYIKEIASCKYKEEFELVRKLKALCFKFSIE